MGMTEGGEMTEGSRETTRRKHGNDRRGIAMTIFPVYF
jgi:hypothetical protein